MKQVAIDYEIDVSQFIVNIHYLKKKFIQSNYVIN